MSEYKTDKREFTGRLLQAVMAVAVFIAFVLFAEGIAAQAADGLSVEEINYYNSTITLRLGTNDTKVFLSNATQKKWEYIPAIIEDKGGYKIAVMDTVDANFSHEWLDNIRKEIGGRKPDYLIIQHMEPDHSANILNFLKTYPNTTIVASSKAFPMMKNFFGKSLKITG